LKIVFTPQNLLVILHLDFRNQDATESDLTRLEQRLQILESFVFDNQESIRTQLGHFLVVERLLAHRVDVILDDVKRNAHEVGLHMQLLNARTEGVRKEINYVRAYIVKLMKWMQGSIKIINALDQLIQGLTWADRDVLSPLIIPTSSLLDMLVYVGAHLEQNTTLRLIPATVNEIHEMVTFYMVSIKGTLLVALEIPLTSYSGPLEVYEVLAHPIRVPNLALDFVLEL